MSDSGELFQLLPTFDVADRRSAQEGRKIGRMLQLYGHGPDGAKCGDCQHMYTKEFAGKYRKCELFGDTAGPGTDWRVRYPACGKFVKR